MLTDGASRQDRLSGAEASGRDPVGPVSGDIPNPQAKAEPAWAPRDWTFRPGLKQLKGQLCSALALVPANSHLPSQLLHPRPQDACL
jgi:hypothetical protein